MLIKQLHAVWFKSCPVLHAGSFRFVIVENMSEVFGVAPDNCPACASPWDKPGPMHPGWDERPTGAKGIATKTSQPRYDYHMDSKIWHIDNLAKLGSDKIGQPVEVVKQEIMEILDEPFGFATIVYNWDGIPNTDAEYALKELENRAQRQA